MQASSYLQAYHLFQEKALSSRFIKHETVATLLKKLPVTFEQKVLGTSYEGRSLTLVKWGKGPVRVFLWSQMHGDEPTGTMTLFDLFNFLQHPLFQAITKVLAENCTLYMLPMVNPDGAERFWRRNAQQIDINRDFNQTTTSEALLLKEARNTIAPHFGFNLHDQSNLWSVKKTKMPAVLSFLAPAYNEELHVNKVRRNAMLVIADIYQNLKPLLPQQVGLFDEQYERGHLGKIFKLKVLQQF